MWDLPCSHCGSSTKFDAALPGNGQTRRYVPYPVGDSADARYEVSPTRFLRTILVVDAEVKYPSILHQPIG